MFSNLSERLTKVIKNLSGQGRITESNVDQTLRDIRIALLEADVALPVAVEFIEHIKSKALGKEVLQSLTPGQALIKLVHDELIATMGTVNEGLNLKAQPPVIVLMAGLQGSGKTTTSAKLADWLKKTQRKSVMLTSVDIYRPAAIEQLETLAKNIDVHFFPSDVSQKPVDIARNAYQEAKNNVVDVLIVDTAGRLHIDKEMMQEITALHIELQPVETLFVVDSMTGQDAANTAKAFHEALPLTGVILTKADGDARGGAALSIRHITGKPIKFIGVGEKIAALEPFHPDRIAQRILGMGDIVTLAEEAERTLDKEKAAKLAKKIQKGKTFTLEDFSDQITQIGNLGGISKILQKLPQLPMNLAGQFDEKQLTQIKAMISSMTLKERRFPERIKNSHKRRIAMGSGTSIQAVNRLLKQFTQMQKMMKKLSKKGGLMKLMRGLPMKFPFGGLPFT